MAELLATSVSLLQRTEQARAAFVASFDAAETRKWLAAQMAGD